MRVPNAFGDYMNRRRKPAAQLGEWRRAASERRRGMLRTTPEHIAHIARAVPGLAPRLRQCRRGSALSGLEREPRSRHLFVNVGERTNVTCSAKFRKLIEAATTRLRSRSPAPMLRTARR